MDARVSTLPFSGKDYPKKPHWFSRRFLRLLFKSCAANDVGPEGLVLLTLVAITEDSRRYRDPPKFWNKQLTDYLALSRPTIYRLIQDCVKHNWLHYEPGAKSRPMVLWTLIPQHLSDMWDGDLDDSVPQEKAADSVKNFDRIRTASEQNVNSIRTECETHSCNTNTTITTTTPRMVEVDFSNLEKRLLDLGLIRARETIQQALSNGTGLETITAVIDYFSSRPGAWGPGALCRRITLGSAHILAPEQGWPTPDSRETDLRRKEAIASDREKSIAERQSSVDRKKRDRQLELEFGPILDALPEEKVIELVTLKKPSLLPELQRRGYRSGSPLVRLGVLGLLASEPCK